MAPHYAVIMAGGSGTRFWPASRRNRPKQLLSFGGADSSLLQATVRRILPLVPADRIFVVTAERLLVDTKEDLRSIPGVRVLAEPAPRNTAPCVGWAASVIADEAADATVMVLPSDHAIADEPSFLAALGVAMASAAAGRITTIGIIPTRPETGYGYIELDGPATAGTAGKVARFVEKPDRARAEGFVAGGKHLWNAGMFFFRASDMLEAIGTHLPALAEGIAAMRESRLAGNEDLALKRVFPTLPSISLDHGVLEKQAGLAVVPGDFGWSDVGSWQSAWELADKDAEQNALPTGTVAVDARGNLVVQVAGSKPGKLIALVGVQDLCVVETEDAILIIPKERAQDVRAVIERIEAAGRTDLL